MTLDEKLKLATPIIEILKIVSMAIGCWLLAWYLRGDDGAELAAAEKALLA